MKICVAGEGAFGNKHLDALANIEGIKVTWLIGGVSEATQSVAKERGIQNWSCDLQDALCSKDVDAVILATPTPMHAKQAKEVMLAGKHVLVEIPMADNLADAQELVNIQAMQGVVAMVGHVRRFNPSHQWIKHKIAKQELNIQHLEAHTHFFRRTNSNAKGEARSWTDHLLWHHACHTVDLFQYQMGQKVEQCFAIQGPLHKDLGIAMDMSIAMKVASGAICTLSLSFNNEGPFGTRFRYICDSGTYVADNDDLLDCHGNNIDLSSIATINSGIELIEREFVAAIIEQREPNASLRQCLGAMETLHKLEQSLWQ
jgi:2-hydroxy-4-carboxymuconate semialdehyde hemiacetal dehydrogenase